MKIRFLLIFIAFSFFSSAQDKKVYLDSLHLDTDEAHHVYYRIVKDYDSDKSQYTVTQYYKTGELESEQISTSKDFLREIGIATSYYRNGNKKNTINYNDKGIKEGKIMFWYENGKPKFEGNFVILNYKKDGREVNESKLKIYSYWNPDNVQMVTDGNGQYTDDGYFDYLSNSSVSSGNIANGYKEGPWTGKDDKRGIVFTETYNNGKLITGKSIDKKGNEYAYEEAFAIAKPKDGINSFYKFVAKTFRSPENLKKRVTVYTRFTVTTQDKITNIRTLKSGGKEVDDEAIRVIMAFNAFTAAKYRGMPIDSDFTFPITLQAAE